MTDLTKQQPHDLMKIATQLSLFDDAQTEIVTAPDAEEAIVETKNVRSEASIAETRKAIMSETPTIAKNKKEITEREMANLNPDNNPNLRADGLPHAYPRNWIFSEIQQQPSGKFIPVVR